MAVNRDFLLQSEKLQESIINRNIDDPGDDPEDRIMRRFTRDLQLITTKTITEIGNLEGDDGIQKGIVWVACAMIEGVAAITASIVNGDKGTAHHFVNQLNREMLRAAKVWMEKEYEDNGEG